MNTAADVLSGDATWGVDLGDVRARLAGWPAASVQCVITSGPYYGLRAYLPPDHPDKASEIGAEPTPEQFVASYVTVFREVRRVLKNDGVLWLNIGDSYAGSWSGKSVRPEGGAQRDGAPGFQSRAAGRGMYAVRNGEVPDGCKPKDLIGIPWMLAFALRADGWHLRADVIWSKPNPMPESIRDRPTKAHEYLFLLTKGPRYYFDAKAIAEKAVGGQGERAMTFQRETKEQLIPGQSATQHRLDRKPKISGGASFGKQRHATNGTGAQSRTYDRPEYLTRNRRSVWTVATQSYKGAHFAVMPPKLVAPCVLAGSRPGDVVADPFAGSGTTLRVAVELGRRAVGVELNPAYLELIAERMAGPPVLTKAKVRKPRREKPAPSLFAGLSE